eukprot:scaffold10895_cov129-Isochrysis_galbana.AAC.2
MHLATAGWVGTTIHLSLRGLAVKSAQRANQAHRQRAALSIAAKAPTFRWMLAHIFALRQRPIPMWSLCALLRSHLSLSLVTCHVWHASCRAVIRKGTNEGARARYLPIFLPGLAIADSRTGKFYKSRAAAGHFCYIPIWYGGVAGVRRVVVYSIYSHASARPQNPMGPMRHMAWRHDTARRRPKYTL